MTKETCKEDKTHDVQNITRKRSSREDDIKYYVCLEDMFNVVQKNHIATGHGGRDKMIKEANKKYGNVSIEALELFKELCEECQLKKLKLASKGLVVKPILLARNLIPVVKWI